MPQSSKKKRFLHECHDSVHVVKFCPFEWSTGVLAVGTTSRVIILNCKPQEERLSVVNVDFETLKEFHHGTRVSDIAWSPFTDLITLPKKLRLFTAGADRNVRCLTSDLKSDTTLTVVGEHKAYVNAVASSPQSGDVVASVSDDNTCCVWSLSDTVPRQACFPLTSPGIAVCWHPNEPAKIMVAEKKGLIRFYSIVTKQAFMSLDCNQSPLHAADWNLANSLRVAALVNTEWFAFDTSLSSQPLEHQQAHTDGGLAIAWSRSHDHLLATIGRPGLQLKVFNIRTNQAVLTEDLRVMSGLSWHRQLPIVAVGGDCRVVLFVVDHV